MRAALALALLLTGTACKREPTFDERYEAAQKKIGETSEEIDAELAGRATPSQSGTPAE